VADEPKLTERQDDPTISAAEAMAMTPEQRAALGDTRIIRDPQNLPPEMLERAQTRTDEIVRRDREREAARHAS
jgi:hypothetical protein